MDFVVTRDDLARLYPSQYEKLKHLTDLDRQLSDLEQPPELGIKPEDDFKRCMLEPLFRRHGLKV